MLEWNDEYIKLASCVARSLSYMELPAYDVDDMRQEACIGIVNALSIYDSSKGSLEPYLRMRARGAVMDGLRHMRNVKRRTWENIRDDIDANGITRYMFPRSDTRIYINPVLDRMVKREDKIRLRRAMLELDHKWRRVVEMYYYKGMSNSEVGAALSISHVRVFQLRQKAIKKLRSIVAGK